MGKKLLLFVGICTLSVGKTLSFDLRGCYKQYFRVSAYYSPVANQQFYYQGNYQSEVRLNGNGIKGASGKNVFNGMLAAPSKYGFGTKIYFPGLGVGEVADRGTSIVSAGERGEKYDRIDIWVGKGEAGLMRALSFGKKIMVGYVCPVSKKIPVGFDYSKFYIYNKFFERTLWAVNLYFGRKGPWVFALQKFLNKLGFLNHVPTGYFGKLTKQALAKFQLQYGIRPADGSFTRKTSYELKKLLKRKGLFPKTSFVKISFAEKLSYPVSTKYVKIKNDLSYLKRGLGVGMRTYEVRILQKYLKYLGFYKGPITGFYGPLTKKAVTKFQLHYKLIRNENVVYAGYFGPKTRNLFKKLVLQKARK